MLEKVKMEAEASENSTVQQAGRDIYNGPTLLQIIETIDYQIEKRVPELLLIHGPQLLEVKNQKVQAEIQEFKQSINSMLESKLVSSNNSDQEAIKILSKVTSSNFQYLFHEGLKNVIRRKENSSKELLIELLSKKLDSAEADDESYILDDAIESLNNLSKNQINFIGFIYALRANPQLGKELGKGMFYIPYQAVQEIEKHQPPEALIELKTLMKENYSIYIDQLVDFFSSQSPTKVDVDYLTAKGFLHIDTKSFTSKNSKIILESLHYEDMSNLSGINLKSLKPKLYELSSFFGVEDIDKLPAFTNKGQIIGKAIKEKIK